MHQHTGIDSDQRCDLTLLGDVAKLNRAEIACAANPNPLQTISGGPLEFKRKTIESVIDRQNGTATRTMLTTSNLSKVRIAFTGVLVIRGVRAPNPTVQPVDCPWLDAVIARE